MQPEPQTPLDKQPSSDVFIYVASPYGFSEAGQYFYYGKLIPMLEAIGFTVIDPWKLTDQSLIDDVMSVPEPERTALWKKLNPTIGKNNAEGVRRSDIVLACLDGIDVDSGTANESGLGYAWDKLVVGYRGDFRLASDNSGSIVNLQVEHSIYGSGGDIYTSLEKLNLGLTNYYTTLKHRKQQAA